MGQSYRIRTELGNNKTINLQLEQDFEFMEILSLKIQQSDIYARPCADYGVIVGRVTANNGFGIPNARVSIFIPVTTIDESDPIITSIYPYKSPTDKNEDGYRYNLLPYEKSYSTHSPTGTLPSRIDVLTGATAIEIYDKYYKFTTKTNDSGDYMIMGVPLGVQTIVMDVDLSDIGEFSLTPQDLIRLGIATESQVSGNKFRSSNDLNSLPQIINLSKSIDISPLWGDPAICQIAINRVDFDLRDDANIDIVPTSIFMGSMFSSIDKTRVRAGKTILNPSYFTKAIKSDLGSLCDLTTGPGQILAIRQTVNVDSDGYPILEVYSLEKSGNVIDQDGTWLVELPMNLDYVVTNEFGEKVISNNPSIGIPTKAKYRFKVKWQQPTDLKAQTRRPYYLVPNIKEYGNNSSADPYDPPTTAGLQLQSSYYFGLDFSGYTRGFVGQNLVNRINEIINCEDTFYEFKFNKVYTVSSLIDQFQGTFGNRAAFIGIKEINNDDCASTVNKFPVNEGYLGFDSLYYLFAIVMTIFQIIGVPFVILLHVVVFIYGLINLIKCGICEIADSLPFTDRPGWCKGACEDIFIKPSFPILKYPSCEACECDTEYGTTPQNQIPTGPGEVIFNGVLSYLSDNRLYVTKLVSYFSGNTENYLLGNPDLFSNVVSYALSGYDDKESEKYKIPVSDPEDFFFEDDSLPPVQYITTNQSYSYDLPLGERINVFNGRKSYFDNLNRIKVTFNIENNPPDTSRFHYDNAIVVLSNQQYQSGELLVSVSTLNSSDPNFLFSGNSELGLISGISGETLNVSNISVEYANPDNQLENLITNYELPYGTDITRYIYPADVEYFQVITAITVSSASQIWDNSVTETFPNILTSNSKIFVSSTPVAPTGFGSEVIEFTLNSYDYFDKMQDQYILILQRGVDPYSSYYSNEYKLGKLFGKDVDDPLLTITATTKLNIPIQKLNTNTLSVQRYTQEDMFYSSYFFKAGTGTDGFSGFSTNNTRYYGKSDSTFNLAGTGKLDGVPLSNNVISLVTNDSNSFYDVLNNPTRYDLSEDLSGIGFMYSSVDLERYYTTIFNESMFITDSTKLIMRTDRLPSSDKLDGEDFSVNPALLQQNNNFRFYRINGQGGFSIDTPTISTGADTTPIDIVGLPGSTKVLNTINNCEDMVRLSCYKGFGSEFEVNRSKPECKKDGDVINGCYIFCKLPFVGIPDDILMFYEWAFRYRFMYGICRGLISETFTNNWINGTLFAFPIQVETKFPRVNRPVSIFPKSLVYFDTSTNNFYYRSSPYNTNTKRFVGRTFSVVPNYYVNESNLMFPTTILDLGMKSRFYSEIIFNPETKAYVMDTIEGTSYGDTSDLTNFFIISRITNANFLEALLSLGDGGIRSLFTRVGLLEVFAFRRSRIDADVAQLYSINSEIGNAKFSSEYYDIESGSATIAGTINDPVIAVWYSSSTEDLQTKDYLTPGRINFRTDDNQDNYPFTYDIKSQIVPFYQWNTKPSNNIFGTQKNNWATKSSDIVQGKRYQSLDRTVLESPTYFQVNRDYQNDLPRRGYIFSVDGNGNYSLTGAKADTFIVGAPFHFYFGLKIGATAYDKFKTKYSTDE